MAVDPKDDDRDDDVDDDDERGPSRRVPKVLGPRKSLPSVESALDDFIVRANQKLLDVSEFTPETREQGLRDEIEDLKKRLAAAEARAELAEAANVPRKRPWGAILGAFVVGGASMFAIHLAMRPDTKREAPAAVAPAASSQTVETKPPTAATDTAVATDTAAQAPTPTATQTPTEPGSTTTAQTPAATAQAQATTQPATTSQVASSPAQAKPPKQGSKTRRPPAQQQPPSEGSTNTTKPPPAEKGSGEGDLYNPF